MSSGRFLDFRYEALYSSERLTAVGELPPRTIGFDHALKALPTNALSVSYPLVVPPDACLPEKWMQPRSTNELLPPRHIPIYLPERMRATYVFVELSVPIPQLDRGCRISPHGIVIPCQVPIEVVVDLRHHRWRTVRSTRPSLESIS